MVAAETVADGDILLSCTGTGCGMETLSSFSLVSDALLFHVRSLSLRETRPSAATSASLDLILA
jgi:hypothetical protein